MDSAHQPNIYHHPPANEAVPVLTGRLWDRYYYEDHYFWIAKADIEMLADLVVYSCQNPFHPSA